MAWIKRNLGKADIRGVFTFLSILFALPLAWGALTGISLWLSPFVMLNSALVLKSLVWLNLLALIPLVLIFFRKRWFCHKICPLGWGCDRVSRWRKGRGVSIKNVPPVGKWLALSSLVAGLAGIPLFMWLDPMNIVNGFFVNFSQGFAFPILLSFLVLPLVLALNIPFPGIWCAKLCPLGGLQDEISTAKGAILKMRPKDKGIKSLRSDGRRWFLVSGAGLTAGLILPSYIKPGEKSFLRPPGSIPEPEFNALCLRCGNCIKSCPTGILKQHMDPQYLFSILVPEISFSDGYCLEYCNTCSQVCPSGSITLFDKDAKKQLFIGFAEIEIENCLLSKNSECDRCKAACSYDAIQIEAREGAFQMQPVVKRDTCVGCGACEVICPPRVIKIVP